MAVVRVMSVPMAWYKSLIMRSFASGVWVMLRVAVATAARRHTAMAVTSSRRRSTTPKPSPRRARVFRLFISLIYYFYGAEE
jgi:hypothetical protein